MADIPNRDELEKQLARKLGKLNRAQMARLLEVLGDPPRIENIPPGFWDEIGEDLLRVISPFLEDVYLTSALSLMESGPIGVDWALVNEGAVTWARQYAFDLVGGINRTSQQTLQRTVTAYFEQGLTRGDLENRLIGIFGPVRAEAIATTEITRAASQGEQAIAGELRKLGVDMVPVWQTNNDELVCPICGPKHNKPIEDNLFPPAHVRCRCWVNYELPKTKKQ